MTSQVTRRRKPGLANQQKRALVLTVMAGGFSVLFITVLLWCINRPGF